MTTLPCATSPELTAMFVGDGPKDDRESNWRYARQLCRSCPVLDECRAMVLTDEANGVPHIGVAGGLLPSERKGAYKENREPPTPPERPTKRPGPKVRVPCGTPSAKRRHLRRGESCSQCHYTYAVNLAPCGTPAARRRHLRRGETCADCELRREWLKPHGTLAACRRHERIGEPPCFMCREARRAAQRERYGRREVVHNSVDASVEGAGYRAQSEYSTQQRSA